MVENKGRLVYLDAIRIVAAFFVLFNHLPGYDLYAISGGVKQGIYLFLTMVTRMNTPLFMMVSGALLIDKEESYSVILRKRVLRFLLVIVVANSIIWLIYKPFNFFDLIFGILKGSIQGSYWYLYSYLGMLFCLPFIRKIAKNMTMNDFWYMLVVHFIIVSVIPCMNFFLAFCGRAIQLSGNLNLAILIESSIFYPIIGYWINKIRIERINRKVVICTVLSTAIGIIIESLFTVYEGRTNGYSQHYVMYFDYLIAICFFMIVRLLFSKFKVSITIEKTLMSLGSVTFGVYLFDPILKKYLYSTIEGILEPMLPTLVVSFLWCLISFLVCGSITFVLRKNKTIKQIL